MRKLLGFVLLLFVAGVFFSVAYRATPTSSNVASVQAAAIEPQPYVSTANDLAARAPEYEIVAACGKPARIWVKKSGKGKFEGVSKHLWYPKVPAEIIAVAFPHDDKEQMRDWTFYGASPSLQSNDMYDSVELKNKMPCMSRWADAAIQAEKDLELARH